MNIQTSTVTMHKTLLKQHLIIRIDPEQNSCDIQGPSYGSTPTRNQHVYSAWRPRLWPFAPPLTMLTSYIDTGTPVSRQDQYEYLVFSSW